MPRTECRLWLLCFLLAAGCNRQDTEALTRISQKVHYRAELLTGDVGANHAFGWKSFGEPVLEARVAARLRWDSQLSGATLEVQARGNNVEIRGKVQSLEQRRRAVMLAESTFGVESVTDKLVLADQ